MSEEIMLGQREIGIGDALTDEEIMYLEKQGVTLPQLHAVLGVTNARMTLDACIGGVANLKKAFAEGETPADPRGLGIDEPSLVESPKEQDESEVED